MNWLNKVGFASPTIGFASGGDELVSFLAQERQEINMMKKEMTQLNNRIAKIKDRVSTSHYNYCAPCNYRWMDTLHSVCPSCNSGDSTEVGWIQEYEDMESTPEPESSKLAPAEGGAARRAATTIDKKGNENE